MRYKLIIILLFSYSLTFAQQNIPIRDSKVSFEPEFIRLEKNYEESISSKDFSAIAYNENNLYSFNNEPKAFWIQFTLKNEFSNQDLFYLSFNNWQEVELIDVENNKEVLITGTTIPYRLKAKPLYSQNLIPIKISQGQTKTYFALLKYNNNTVIKPSSFELEVYTESKLLQEQSENDVIIGFFLGIFLIMFFYNLFIYSSVKSTGYLYYLGLVLFNICTLIFNFGYHYNIFTFDAYPLIYPYFDNILSFGYAFCMIQLSRKFLNIQFHFKYFDLYLKVLLSFVGLTVLLQFTVMDVYSAFELSSMLGLLTFISLLTIAIASSKKRIPSSKYFLFAISFFLIGLGFFLLSELNLLSFNQYNHYSLQIGASLQLLFYAFGLANQINTLKKENDHKQRLIIRQLREKEELQQDANDDLENQIILNNDALSEERNQLSKLSYQLISGSQHLSKSDTGYISPPSGLDSFLKDYFILSHSKKGTSNEFYWINEVDGKIVWLLFKTNDENGLSNLLNMTAHLLLNDIILNRKVLNSQSIYRIFHLELKKMTDLEFLNQSIFILDKETKELEFFEKQNSFWIVRNSKVIDLKALADIVVTEEENNMSRIMLHQDDIIYSYTGVAPTSSTESIQFEDTIKNCIEETLHPQLTEQGINIKQHISNLATNQTDDILILAMKID